MVFRRWDTAIVLACVKSLEFLHCSSITMSCVLLTAIPGQALVNPQSQAGR
jgi:hypothetical protein